MQFECEETLLSSSLMCANWAGNKNQMCSEWRKKRKEKVKQKVE